jgi:hypothetical protein
MRGVVGPLPDTLTTGLKMYVDFNALASCKFPQLPPFVSIFRRPCPARLRRVDRPFQPVRRARLLLGDCDRSSLYSCCSSLSWFSDLDRFKRLPLLFHCNNASSSSCDNVGFDVICFTTIHRRCEDGRLHRGESTPLEARDQSEVVRSSSTSGFNLSLGDSCLLSDVSQCQFTGLASPTAVSPCLQPAEVSLASSDSKSISSRSRLSDSSAACSRSSEGGRY